MAIRSIRGVEVSWSLRWLEVVVVSSRIGKVRKVRGEGSADLGAKLKEASRGQL